MKLKIDEIYSKNMFPGLIMGKAKMNDYQESLQDMEKLLTSNFPIHNVSEIIWTQLFDGNGKSMGYGTWGHITGAKCVISEGSNRYSFSVIFNYIPEKEILDEKLKEVISKIDYHNNSYKWDIGDL